MKALRGQIISILLGGVVIYFFLVGWPTLQRAKIINAAQRSGGQVLDITRRSGRDLTTTAHIKVVGGSLGGRTFEVPCLSGCNHSEGDRVSLAQIADDNVALADEGRILMRSQITIYSILAGLLILFVTILSVLGRQPKPA